MLNISLKRREKLYFLQKEELRVFMKASKKDVLMFMNDSEDEEK